MDTQCRWCPKHGLKKDKNIWLEDNELTIIKKAPREQ